MDITSQVRATHCVAALALLPFIRDSNWGLSRAHAQAADTTCVDPSSYTRSVVSIAWYFDKERLGHAGVAIVGERATAWFYGSPRFLVTPAHFAHEFPAQGWHEVELRQAITDEGAGRDSQGTSSHRLPGQFLRARWEKDRIGNPVCGGSGDL